MCPSCRGWECRAGQAAAGSRLLTFPRLWKALPYQGFLAVCECTYENQALGWGREEDCPNYSETVEQCCHPELEREGF